jgi:hypothetical protein
MYKRVFCTWLQSIYILELMSLLYTQQVAGCMKCHICSTRTEHLFHTQARGIHVLRAVRRHYCDDAKHCFSQVSAADPGKRSWRQPVCMRLPTLHQN